jgi:hypothetical protein
LVKCEFHWFRWAFVLVTFRFHNSSANAEMWINIKAMAQYTLHCGFRKWKRARLMSWTMDSLWLTSEECSMMAHCSLQCFQRIWLAVAAMAGHLVCLKLLIPTVPCLHIRKVTITNWN